MHTMSHNTIQPQIFTNRLLLFLRKVKVLQANRKRHDIDTKSF